MSRIKKKDIVKVEINNLEVRKSKDYLKGIKEHHLDVIRKYDREKKNNSCSKATRLNYIRLLMQFIKETNKSFDQITRDDVDEFLAKREGSTLEQYKLDIKAFFEWFEKPELITHLKWVKPPEKLTAEDMWTEDEVLRLLKVTDNGTKELDQAIIMTMFDLAVEKKVIENAKIKDVYDSGDILRLKVIGKRRGEIQTTVLECIHCASYLRRWLNIHPNPNNPDAPLFCQLNPKAFGKPLHSIYVWQLCKKLQRRSGILKELRPHLLRHSKASDLYRRGFRGKPLARRLRQKSVLTQLRYSHLFNEDMDDELYILETGVNRNQRKHQPKRVLMQVPCPKCGELNQPTSNYCTSCLYVLNQDMATLEVSLIDMLRSRWFKDIKENIKKLEDEGYNIRYEQVSPENLAEKYITLKEQSQLSKEERISRAQRELQRLIDGE